LWFSNLFAFFPPIYSYDEPLQYTFLFAALIALYAHRYVLFVLLFAVAAIARESQVILLPAIWFFVQPIAFDRPAKLFSAPSLMRALLLGLPVLIYVGFTLIYAQSIGLQLGNSQAAAERFAHFDLNFSHQPEAIETFLSIFLAFCATDRIRSSGQIVFGTFIDAGPVARPTCSYLCRLYPYLCTINWFAVGKFAGCC